MSKIQSWEHHARVQNVTNTDLILHYMNNFNASGPFNSTGGGGPSEGLKLHLNLSSKTTTVLKNLVDANEPIYNDAQGTFDPLPNGNPLLGYGQIPAIKEFGSDGNNDVRMTIWYEIHNNSGVGAQSYRTYRRIWVGTPEYPPSVVVKKGVLYMSWNGATGITRWEILAGEDVAGKNSEVVGVVDTTGFETMFRISNGCVKVVKVAA
jgi:Arylsulfotransferase (ASST)